MLSERTTRTIHAFLRNSGFCVGMFLKPPHRYRALHIYYMHECEFAVGILTILVLLFMQDWPCYQHASVELCWWRQPVRLCLPHICLGTCGLCGLFLLQSSQQNDACILNFCYLPTKSYPQNWLVPRTHDLF